MKLPKIPARLKIKNKVVYEVVWVDSFKDPLTVGECRPWARQIALKTGASEKQLFKTFVHEVLHAIEVERGVKLSHDSIYKLEDAVFYIFFHNIWK